MRQFFITHFTDHACGSSIPRRLRIWAWVAAFWVADRMPWFLRKRLINILAGREIMHDFMCAEQLTSGSFIDSGWVICVKN
jgi:hypothetical protein